MRLTVTLFIFSAYWSLLQFLVGSPAPAPELPATPAAVVSNALPDPRTLEFVENKGQWPEQVAYAADVPGGKMFLQPTGFMYVLRDPAQQAHGHAPETSTTARRSIPSADRARNHAYSVTFENANPAALVQADEVTEGVRNYYLGNDPAKWGAGARGFRKVQYKALYRGVDMALYEQAGKLKYDLHLAAGTSPAQIKLTYTGATSLSLQEGNLHIETSVGRVVEHKPVAYQWVQNRRVPVACAYQLSGNTIQFVFPEGYDSKLPLVIDPVVEFSTFTGSFADNWGFTATYDSQGNMYSGGIASGTGYPVSTGAFDTSFNGSWDIAIIKYNTKAVGPAARLYATYLGGSFTEVPHSLVVNAQDELLILGTTSSLNYPTSANALGPKFNGGSYIAPLGTGGNPIYDNGSDLVVTRLSATGDKLLASTFLGGTGNDGLLSKLATNVPSLVQNYGDQFRGDIITDPDGNVYIATNTASTDFPAANGFRSQALGGTNDAMICKLAPDLSRVIWGSYYGGPEIDAAYSIQLDQNRQVYVCGGTTSSTIAGTANGLNKTSAGNTDGFVLKINSAGTSILAATFLGTSAYDQTYFLQLDASNSVYVLGQTLGDYPLTNGTYRNANGRQFIHKLNNALTATEFSTVFGSGRNTLDISPSAFMVDDCQRIYVAGWGGSSNASYGNGSTTGLPVTPGAVQTTTDGGDFYLMQLGTNATQLLYATFYGGNQLVTGGSYEHVDGGTSRYDKKGYVYQAVCGGCQGRTNFPIPPGANFYSPINNSSNCNNAAFKFDFAEELRADAGPDQEVCADAPGVILKGTPTGGVWSGSGVSLVNGVYMFTPSASLIGRQTLTYTVTGTGACSIANDLIMTVAEPLPHTLTLPATQFCANNNVAIPLVASPAGGVFSGTGVTGATFNPATAGVGRHKITYRSDGSNGICGSVTQEVNVVLPVLALGPDTTLCPGSVTPFQLRANLPGGTWTGPNVSASGFFTPPAGFTGTIEVTYTITEPCLVSQKKRVLLPPRPTMTASLSNACVDNGNVSGYAPYNAAFSNTTGNATGFTWYFGDGTQSTERSPRHLYQNPGSYKVRLVATYGNGCQDEMDVGTVEVEAAFIPNIFTPNGDPVNETFVQRFSCFPTELTVYNRWGKQVHYEKVYQQNWNGGKLSDGTYFYILKDSEGNTAKGWVEIIR